MQVFKDYASYYDLLYQDKDYELETNYIINLIQEYGDWILNPVFAQGYDGHRQVQDDNKILELGSGTGKHAILLAQKGYKLFGLDYSQEMVDIAKNR